MYATDLLRALPKTDLHVHLDGSLRLGTLIDLARERSVGLPSTTEAGLNELVFKPSYANLAEYLAGFALTGAVMQDADALEQVSYELAVDCLEENVCYVEVRFAPQLHMGPDFDVEQVVRAVDRGLDRARREHEATAAVVNGTQPPFRYGIILCALRMFDPSFSLWYKGFCEALGEARPKHVHAEAATQLACAAVRLRDAGVPVVGFDLAGHEAGFPATRYARAFDHASRHFLKRTVHAGEAYGPESIYQALSELHADRIGHGYHLFSPSMVQDPRIKDPQGFCDQLAAYIADRRTTIEVCITSNLQTNPAIGGVDNHAFRHMLRNRLSATLCTDNRLVSHTTVTREYELATAAFEMTPAELRNTITYGFKRSFFPGSYTDKRAYVRQVLDRYDAVWAEHTDQG
jgi:adenosine deaminase